MKLRRIHIAWVAISLLFSVLYSCIEKERIQPLSNRFEAFVTPSQEGSETLLGVRDRLTGDTLIPPGKYLSAKADTNVIQLTLPDGRIRAYSDRGLPISPIAFDSFIPIGLENSIEVYYLGTNRQERFYYFPKRHLTIDGKRMVCNNGTHFGATERNGTIQFFDFQGNRIWKAPQGSRVVFPNPDLPTDFFIAVPGDTTRYSPEGKPLFCQQ
jgi:hypothetical protein